MTQGHACRPGGSGRRRCKFRGIPGVSIVELREIHDAMNIRSRRRILTGAGVCLSLLVLAASTAGAQSKHPKINLAVGYGNNRIEHLDAQGRFVKSWGELGVKAGQLSQPHSIAVDSGGRFYVAERNNCRIQVFSQEGSPITEWRNFIKPGEMTTGCLDWGHGPGVDSKGNIHFGDVADESLAHRVQKFIRLPAEQ